MNSPFQSELLFQIVEQGAVNIYFIRDDGTRYSLSNGKADHLLGDMDIFYPRSGNIYVEAAERLTCISFSIEKNRERLLADNAFLKLICNSLSAKIGTMAAILNPELRKEEIHQPLRCDNLYKCGSSIILEED
ncbi:hypothetical protein [uncultured Acetatifactor sp.]|uniref:hypothetical protein n=1 Tax=uncultured Acetatifactor sp. TaxID=1671927 RepID=UPI0026147701|nr:hypothetical protein [uncultured Acetatifactor sp.]